MEKNGFYGKNVKFIEYNKISVSTSFLFSCFSYKKELLFCFLLNLNFDLSDAAVDLLIRQKIVVPPVLLVLWRHRWLLHSE